MSSAIQSRYVVVLVFVGVTVITVMMGVLVIVPVIAVMVCVLVGMTIVAVVMNMLVGVSVHAVMMFVIRGVLIGACREGRKGCGSAGEGKCRDKGLERSGGHDRSCVSLSRQQAM